MSGSGTGTLLVSIDLELDLHNQEPELQRRLDEVQRQLVGLTGELQVPATWAVADPTLSAATDSIRAAGCGHEIAVLGQQAWLGQGCGRVRLARELKRRFDGARQAGIAVTTLALRDIELIPDLDLLLDHGVTALRKPPVDSLSAIRKMSSPAIRFGIWTPPATWRIPLQTRWWAPSTWLVRREIKRAIRRQTIAHLEIDAPGLVAALEPALALIRFVLHYAATKRDRGQLNIQTIGQCAARALSERMASPSRSILRPAA